MILKTLIVFFLIIVGFISQAVAQRVITDEEFGKVSSAVWKFVRENKRRVTSTEENGNRSGKTIVEYEADDRSHSVKTEKVDGVTRTSEKITIGAEVYTRENGGEWSKFDPNSNNRYTIAGNVKTDRSTSNSLSPDIVLEGKKTMLYEQTTTDIYTGPDNSESVKMVRKVRLWVDADGRLLKQESHYKYGDYPGNVFISYFEYDPTIIVKAPVLREKKEK